MSENIEYTGSLGSIGKILRQAREEQGLTVEDVAKKTKFSVRQIEALESDSLQQTSSSEIAYLRGFVRNYARAVGVSEQRVLGLLPQPAATQAELVPVAIGSTFSERSSMGRNNKIWLAAAAALSVVVVSFAIWHYVSPVTKETPMDAELASTPVGPVVMPVLAPEVAPNAVVASGVPAENTLQPTVVTTASAVPTTTPESVQVPAPQVAATTETAKPFELPTEPTSAGPIISHLRFEFDEDAWVQIKDKYGRTLSSKLNRRGSELKVEGQKPFSLIVGHAVAVKMYDQDKPVDLKPYIDVNVARLTLQ